MRRTILIICLLIIGLLATIKFISDDKKKEIKFESFYSILESRIYSYDAGDKMEIKYYSDKSGIAQLNCRYYLLSDEKNFELTSVKLKEQINCYKGMKKYYLYKLEADLPKPEEDKIEFKAATLLIQYQNTNVKLNLGYIAVYLGLPQLEYFDLYGNYAYIDGELKLVGITVCLDKSYRFLSKLDVGLGFADLNLIKNDELYPSELDSLVDGYEEVVKNPAVFAYPLQARQDYYFIPIAYQVPCLIQTTAVILNIDGQEYIIPDFCYYLNYVKMTDYPFLLQEGVIDSVKT